MQEQGIITIICLPLGSRSILGLALLTAITNYGLGYGYLFGCDSAGSVLCSTNFNSESELLQHLKTVFK